MEKQQKQVGMSGKERFKKKRQGLLRVSKEKKLQRVMITHALKGHNKYKLDIIIAIKQNMRQKLLEYKQRFDAL